MFHAGPRIRITLMLTRIRLVTSAGPDPTCHFNADPDPAPAPHLNDADLQLLFRVLNFFPFYVAFFCLRGSGTIS